jgi:hypothetical protein
MGVVFLSSPRAHRSWRANIVREIGKVADPGFWESLDGGAIGRKYVKRKAMV